MFSSPDVLGLNQTLFTHSAIQPSECSGLSIDWEATSFDLRTTRDITFKYLTEIRNLLAIKYLPRTTPIKLRQPLRVSSKAKLRSTVKITKYEVFCTLNETPNQLRRVSYASPTSYNLYSLDRTLFLTNPRLQDIKVSLVETIPSVSRTIGGLPSTKAYVYDLQQYSLSNFEEPTNAIAKLVIPSVKDGLLPAVKVGTDMNSKTPLSIAWGLLAACAKECDLLVLQTLKGLIYEALNRSYLISNGLEVFINPDAYWGFEENFVPGALQDDSIRDIADNAFLGWAVCHAIRYLQDRLPLDAYSLDGEYQDFKQCLSQFVLSLGYLCAYAVSPVSWWVCERFEGGSFNYEAVSQKASYLTDIFLNELLQIIYDPFIHSRAARLFLAIESAPTDPLNNFYSTFVNTNSQALVYKAFRSWKYQQDYVYLLEQLNAGNTTDYEAAIASYLFSKGDTYPEWLAIYYAQRVDIANGLELCLGNFCEYAPILLADSSYTFRASEPFNLYAYEADAKVTETLLELRRLWPTGQRWGTSEVLNSITSTLGSLFYAEASLYFDFYLTYFLTKAGRAFDTAQADFAKDWARQFLNTDALYSDYFIRDWVYAHLNREYTTDSDIEYLLQGLWGYFFGVLNYKLPAAFSLEDTTSLLEDSYSSYTSEDHEFNGKYFTTLETNSILYKAGSTLELSEDRLLISEEFELDGTNGYLPRKVAGFPYRNVLISDATLFCDSDLLVNEEYNSMPTTERLMYADCTLISELVGIDCSHTYWYNDDLYVLDGSVMLKRLSDYAPKLELNLNAGVAPLLHEYLTSTLADGVSYRVSAQNQHFNSSMFIYRGLGCGDEWRFDNFHRFDNIHYT